MNPTTTTPLEDDEIIGGLLMAAEKATHSLKGRSLEELLSTPETRETLRHYATEMGEAALQVSEMMRNWASHIPWELLISLRDGAQPLGDDDAVRALWSFFQEQFPPVRMALQEMWQPAHLRRKADPVEEYALDKNTYDFFRPAGRDLLKRTEEYYGWVEARRQTETWPYSRTLEVTPGSKAQVTNEAGRRTQGINFASQDYLSLNAHPAVREAAARALHDFGPHSAGSAMAVGNTRISEELEQALASLVQMEHITLFPTGWAAGFGAVVGLVRPEDHVLIDRLAHACLQQGARAATKNVIRYEHLNSEAVRQSLKDIRARDSRNGILVVTDALFSVDADWPDLITLQAVCREYDATLLVDVAHDLGSMGPGGTGVLGMQDLLGKVDLVMGAFSKSFASNGGFLASHSPAVKQYVKMFGGSHMFSNALSPVQTAVVLKATELIRSPEGDTLRAKLFGAVHALREELTGQGLTCMGSPSPIVPLLIGNEKLARTVYRLFFDRGVLAVMVEFPVTPIGAARFRLQVQASHEPGEAREAARVIGRSISDARAHLTSAFGSELV
ncbi:MAG: pyridoxal phosphate-dependent aminotransferase family protein [Myxococcaceae bacterium]|nr:pyridoxal phosphate-dependent aminotransferase family protein [Myxococcaceae bacterium]